MKKLMVAVTVVAAAAELFAIQGSVSTPTETVSGDVKWHARDKKYVIEKGKITKEFPLDGITDPNIPKPAGLDKAIQQVEAGQGASAIATLVKIVADYRMLTWDKPAGRALAQAYIAAGDAKKALDACQQIISDDKAAAYTGDLAPAYWQALLKLGKTEQLETQLKKAAASGDRVSAAAALVMRGDIILAGTADQPETLRKALTDGYMRVVLMYPDADCVRERREATLKAAGCFDKLGQAARAEKLRAQAKAM